MQKTREKQNRILASFTALTLVLALVSGFSAPVFARDGLTEYVIDLTIVRAKIEAGSEPGTVAVSNADVVIEDNLDPAAIRFVLTTGGKETGNSFGISKELVGDRATDLNLTFRDCRIHADQDIYYSAYNDYGAGRVNLKMEGTNELWSGSKRAGLRVPENRTYDVYGPGLLSVKGGAPAGSYGNNGYEPAGKIILRSGTILAAGNNKSNTEVSYWGGSLNLPLKDGAPVKDYGGNTLYPVTVDFSDPYVQNCIALSDTLSVNGSDLTLDDEK